MSTAPATVDPTNLVAPGGPLAGRVIGVYGSGGAPWHHLALAAARGASVRVVRAEDVMAGRLDQLDVLIMPGGGAVAMAGLLAPLGVEGAQRIRQWVGAGGTYVSSCAGSVLPLALTGAADAANPIARHMRMLDIELANTGDATLGGLCSPGVGRIRVKVAPDRASASDLPPELELVHYNGPLFAIAAGGSATVRPFAWPVGATPAFTPAERFLAGNETRETTLQRCIDLGAATAIEAEVGAGRAVLFGSHPEFGVGSLLLGWGHGSELLTAALASPMYGTDRGPADTRAESGWHVAPEHPERSPAEHGLLVADSLRRAAERFERLAASEVSASASGWLTPDMAAKFHGVDAATAWQRDTRAAATVAGCAASQLLRLETLLDQHDLPWLDDAPRSDQDFGYMGLTQLVAKIHAMLDGAELTLLQQPQRPQHAYDLFDSHPFHLAVGSYLSAAGLTAGALLVSALLAFRHGATTAGSEALLWTAPRLAAATGQGEDHPCT